MAKYRLSDGSIVDLTPEEEQERTQQHADFIAKNEAIRKAIEARERLLDALAADNPVDPQDRQDFKDNLDKLPGRGGERGQR